MQQLLLLVKLEDDEAPMNLGLVTKSCSQLYEICNLKSKYQANKNKHYSCFRPTMIIAGPKAILNVSAITETSGDFEI
jgi:hypothetical protein